MNNSDKKSYMKFNKILIAVDSSAFSLKAAECGLTLAHTLNVEVAIVYVIDRNKESVLTEVGPSREQSEIALLKEAQDTIEQMIKMYNGIRDVNRFILEGFPKDEILNTANEWGADLIVMGTHGRSGLSHLFNGSIAEDVIKHANIPIMIVPHDVH